MHDGDIWNLEEKNQQIQAIKKRKTLKRQTNGTFPSIILTCVH